MPLLRLQKILAEAGVASRRGAERLIQAGRVRVNGRVIAELGAKADPEADRIELDGRPLQPREARCYVLLHKPAGYLTTRVDPRGRPTVFALLPELGVRLHPVGRLDGDAEGLLLLTNDGVLTYRLTHPRHGVPRVYEVQVEGRLTPADLATLRAGVLLEDGPAVPERVRLLGHEGGRSRLQVTLSEGRYREVKRIFQALGHPVRRLVRIQFGPLRLGRLPVGKWRPLTPAEVRALTAAGPPEPQAGNPLRLRG